MKIQVSLSHKSIEEAIKKLEGYRDSFGERNQILCRRLADIGVNAAMMTLATKGQGDSLRSASFNISFDIDGQKVSSILSITSTPTITKDGRVFYPHLAWEFGAGNHFNGMVSPEPHAKSLGMGPGTFPKQTHVPTPEQTHVPTPGFWYYRDEHGDAVRSYGTQATMPMYNAILAVIKNIESVAKEVYK